MQLRKMVQIIYVAGFLYILITVENMLDLMHTTIDGIYPEYMHFQLGHAYKKQNTEIF